MKYIAFFAPAEREADIDKLIAALGDLTPQPCTKKVEHIQNYEDCMRSFTIHPIYTGRVGVAITYPDNSAADVGLICLSIFPEAHIREYTPSDELFFQEIN